LDDKFWLKILPNHLAAMLQLSLFSLQTLRKRKCDGTENFLAPAIWTELQVQKNPFSPKFRKRFCKNVLVLITTKKLYMCTMDQHAFAKYSLKAIEGSTEKINRCVFTILHFLPNIGTGPISYSVCHC
jgi:hypothetical protein